MEELKPWTAAAGLGYTADDVPEYIEAPARGWNDCKVTFCVRVRCARTARSICPWC